MVSLRDLSWIDDEAAEHARGTLRGGVDPADALP